MIKYQSFAIWILAWDNFAFSMFQGIKTHKINRKVQVLYLSSSIIKLPWIWLGPPITVITDKNIKKVATRFSNDGTGFAYYEYVIYDIPAK